MRYGAWCSPHGPQHHDHEVRDGRGWSPSARKTWRCCSGFAEGGLSRRIHQHEERNVRALVGGQNARNGEGESGGSRPPPPTPPTPVMAFGRQT